MKTKHLWTYEEELYCAEQYIKHYIINKEHILKSDIANLIHCKFPHLKINSINDKILNIKQICIDLNIQDSLYCAPLPNYSKNNLLAIKEVLSSYGIKFNE